MCEIKRVFDHMEIHRYIHTHTHIHTCIHVHICRERERERDEECAKAKETYHMAIKTKYARNQKRPTILVNETYHMETKHKTRYAQKSKETYYTSKRDLSYGNNDLLYQTKRDLPQQ